MINFKKEKIFNSIELILIVILVVVPTRFFLFEPFLVKGESMEPNFHNFDYLIIDKLTYKFSEPKRGDVVVFHPPVDDKVFYIKRIVGLPNEKLVIRSSKITIYNKEYPNGFTLEENYLKGHYTSDVLVVNLKDDEYFVLGDNREVSYDSRKWGPIKRDKIVGKVILRLSFFNFFDYIKKLNKNI